MTAFTPSFFGVGGGGGGGGGSLVFFFRNHVSLFIPCHIHLGVHIATPLSVRPVSYLQRLYFIQCHGPGWGAIYITLLITNRVDPDQAAIIRAA